MFVIFQNKWTLIHHILHLLQAIYILMSVLSFKFTHLVTVTVAYDKTEPTNYMNTRTHKGISFGPMLNLQVSYTFLCLETVK